MTNPNKTDITLILDRSGSMASCLTDTVGGFNTFVEDQRKDPEECFLTLVQFDDKYQVDYKGMPISDVPPLIAGENYQPRGMTALMDAVGKTINTVGERLAKMPEEQRPGKVLFVIQTDGMENASKEFQPDRVKSMIEHQKKEFQWEFMFLGADLTSVAQAGAMGISRDMSMAYNGDVDGAMRGMSVAASSYKGGGDYKKALKDEKGKLGDTDNG